jgi:hypothetical protein
MGEYHLPKLKEAVAYLDDSKRIRLALHGHDYADDRVGALTPAQALKLAEYLVRAAREALVGPTGLEYRGG